MSDIKILNRVAQAIYDKKGFNILVLDVRGICSITNYFIIAEGSVDRHVKAICHSLENDLLKEGEHPVRIEGEQEGDWIVLDYLDFIVHLLTPEMRERYSLETLWSKGSVVDVVIDTTAPEIKKSSFQSFNEPSDNE